MGILVLILWLPILGVFFGSLYFLVSGLLRRSLRRCLGGLPFIIMLTCWLVVSSVNPDPRKSFVSAFLVEPPASVRDLKSEKRTFMDGHFLIFSISEKDLSSIAKMVRIPRENAMRNTRGVSLPKECSIADETAFFTMLSKDPSEPDVFLFWNASTEKAFAIVWYPSLY